MLTRHKILLDVLLLAPKTPTRLDLMKWLFLLRQESELADDNSFYDFVPYKYGPFSFLVYREIDYLSKVGYLTNSNSVMIGQGKKGKVRKVVQTLPESIQVSLKNLLIQYGTYNTKDLVDYVYEKYPWFAIRSELLPKPKEKAKPKKSVYTIGYEGISIDKFLQNILINRVDQVIDVRKNPLSRKYGFSKKKLSHLCHLLDISYIHIPELGIPSSLRRELKSIDDYHQLMLEYEQNILPRTIDKVSALMRKKLSALTCFESDSSICHRGKVANAVASITGMPIIHL
jgi:uncharacterized protein (DUF488 family)